MRLSTDVLGELLRAPAPRPKQATSRERAAANKLRVLQAVAEHGHLRCVDLAAACWPGARYGEQMAQRTVRTLVESGELKPRANALGGTSFVLTRPGAAGLEVHGIAAHHGLDTYPSGRVLSLTYANGLPTALGLKASAGATAQSLMTGVQFSPFGGVQSWNWSMTAGPLAVSRVYDTSGRLVRYPGYPLGTLIRDVNYDAGDRISGYKHYDASSAAARQRSRATTRPSAMTSSDA